MKPIRLWVREQWDKSNILSGVLAIMIWGTIVYMAIAQLEIPGIVATGGGAIIVYFYGEKLKA